MKKNISSLFRDGKVFGLYFRSQNLEGTYRATFRDGNLETEIFPCLNRDGNNFLSLNRDENCFPSLFRDGNVFPCLNREGKIFVSKFPSLFFNFLVVTNLKMKNIQLSSTYNLTYTYNITSPLKLIMMV